MFCDIRIKYSSEEKKEEANTHKCKRSFACTYREGESLELKIWKEIKNKFNSLLRKLVFKKLNIKRIYLISLLIFLFFVHSVNVSQSTISNY